MKREITGEENSLAGTLPEDCLVGQIRNMINSISRDWKEIGDNGRR